jgi:hypothetical protein
LARVFGSYGALPQTGSWILLYFVGVRHLLVGVTALSVSNLKLFGLATGRIFR